MLLGPGRHGFGVTAIGYRENSFTWGPKALPLLAKAALPRVPTRGCGILQEKI
jgi:hypothetical protein